MALFYPEQQSFVEGKDPVIEIIRKDAQERDKTLELRAPIEKFEVPGRAIVEANDESHGRSERDADAMETGREETHYRVLAGISLDITSVSS